MELLVAVSIALTGVMIGLVASLSYWHKSLLRDLEAKAAALNVSIESFGKAYSDFNARALEIESRFSTLEFKLTGMTGKG